MKSASVHIGMLKLVVVFLAAKASVADDVRRVEPFETS